MDNLYWEYAGTRYKRKIQATLAAGRHYKSIQCHAFDDSFLSYDFTAEPPQTLSELVDERVKQIRDKHSYIKFWFSGGADSTTVLNAFLRNNIHIDEIICYTQSLTDNHDHIANYELTEHTIPYLHKLSYDLPKTKINIMRFGGEHYEKALCEDFWFTRMNNLDPRGLYIPNIRGKNYCNLFCDMDPHVTYNGSTWVETIWDTSNLEEMAGYRNIELFYTTPDLPQLHAKQCHFMKNFYKKNPGYSSNRYKYIIRNFLRDTPIAREHFSYSKDTLPPIQKHFIPVRSKLMMKDAIGTNLLEKIKYNTTLTVDNIPIYRLGHGYPVAKLDLGV